MIKLEYFKPVETTSVDHFSFPIREKRHLNIDMRIGVHSGDVLSGVIGAAKWQFDIWSKDVDIANRLEATGATGRVHVSQKTLALLDGEYFFEDGTEKAREDPVLQKHGIRTFLIKSLRVSITGGDWGHPQSSSII